MLKLKQKVEVDGRQGYIIGMDIDPFDRKEMKKMSDQDIVYVIRFFDKNDDVFDYLRSESDLKVIK